MYSTILANLNYYEEPKEILENLMETDAKTKYSAMHVLATLEKKRNNKKRARMLYEKNIASSPFQEDGSKFNLAELEYLEGNIEAARELLNSVEGNQKANAMLLLSQIELDNDNIPEAKKILNDIEEEFDEGFNRNFLLTKGRMEFSLSNFKEARKLYKEILNGPRDTVYWKAQLSLANLENYIGNYREALRICDYLIDSKKTVNGEVYLIKSKIYEYLGNYEEAITNCLEVKNSTNSNLIQKMYQQLGILCFEQENYDQSIKYFESIKDGSRYKKFALLNTVHAYMKMNDYKNAEKILLEIVESKAFDINNPRFLKTKILIDKKLGRDVNYNGDNYGIKQYANYNKQEAIRHIINRHCHSSNENKSTFSNEINIEKLIDEIQEYLIEDNLVSQPFTDAYIIDYPGVGVDFDGENLDSLKVVTIPNTKDIITMFPKKNNYLKTNNKVKKKTKVEEFNNKYDLE